MLGRLGWMLAEAEAITACRQKYCGADAQRPNHARRRSASEIWNPPSLDCRCSRQTKAHDEQLVITGRENRSPERQAGQPFKRRLPKIKPKIKPNRLDISPNKPTIDP
jgi:hypothetical protein